MLNSKVWPMSATTFGGLAGDCRECQTHKAELGKAPKQTSLNRHTPTVLEYLRR